MTDQQEIQNELLTRIELVEMMIQEGRRSTEYWDWSFVLWGAAYLIATAWSYWLHMPMVAWLVTIFAALGITAAVIRSKKKKHLLLTTVSRSIGAIWRAVGIALIIFCFSVGLSGHGEAHSYVAAIECFLGVTNFASGIMLRWRVQLLIALMWWTAGAVTCFVPSQFIAPIFVAATLIGMIGFGLYMMYCQHRENQLTVQHG